MMPGSSGSLQKFQWKSRGKQINALTARYEISHTELCGVNENAGGKCVKQQIKLRAGNVRETVNLSEGVCSAMLDPQWKKDWQPLTLAIGGIHYFHLQGIPSSFQVGHTSTALPPGEWGPSITRLNRRRENLTLHLLPTTVDRDEDVLYNCAVRCCSSP